MNPVSFLLIFTSTASQVVLASLPPFRVPTIITSQISVPLLPQKRVEEPGTAGGSFHLLWYQFVAMSMTFFETMTPLL